MELDKEYCDQLERDKFLIVRNATTNTPYAIFELKDEPGAAISRFKNELRYIENAK